MPATCVPWLESSSRERDARARAVAALRREDARDDHLRRREARCPFGKPAGIVYPAGSKNGWLGSMPESMIPIFTPWPAVSSVWPPERRGADLLRRRRELRLVARRREDVAHSRERAQPRTSALGSGTRRSRSRRGGSASRPRAAGSRAASSRRKARCSAAIRLLRCRARGRAAASRGARRPPVGRVAPAWTGRRQRAARRLRGAARGGATRVIGE